MSANDPLVWLPYCGAAPLPTELLSRWNLDPVLIAVLGAAAIALWRAGRTREQRLSGSFALGLAAALFVSPFCALSSALFSARAIHHIVLVAVLAPLLAYAVPLGRLRWTVSLAAWTGLQAVVFWLWHAPPLYAQALSSSMIYWIMQITLLGTSVGFWADLRRTSGPAAIGALLFSSVQMGLLGALLTFAPDALYAPHFLSTALWGLTPLEDQQLAGIIMWAPAAGLYLAAALALAFRHLAEADRESAT